ncbi:MAG: 6-phosphogluconolactonase [Kordiimonadaceae bacterium]|jgi:6-phosphogluconolactonase|nr:6-phosphogluconolactonase [Kordiimonadaceae bacterium]MBT6032825.1 6-phosphogluconolactonase [Kordiimonadaceae bacterium]MBT6330120.1 6-phosphogluconolactonase [Kordiimonadaceae bacterium]
MTDLNDYKFDNRDELLLQLKDDVMSSLSQGLDSRNKASMLLSGGTTPGPLYNLLSEQELSWHNVWFAPTDERWVEPDHQDSNERLIRETLLQNNAKNANYIGLKSAGDDPFIGQKQSNRNIAAMVMPFDVVLLGMGEDGHVASLFPGLEDTAAAMDEKNENFCHGIRRGGGDTPRMSMTLNSLLNAKKIILLFYGTKKLKIFERARLFKTDALPVSYLLHQNKVPVSLYWAN